MPLLKKSQVLHGLFKPLNPTSNFIVRMSNSMVWESAYIFWIKIERNGKQKWPRFAAVINRLYPFVLWFQLIYKFQNLITDEFCTFPEGKNGDMPTF